MLGRSDRQESEIPDGNPTGTRVLVVDDCSETAHVCSKLLQLSGFEVAIAFNGFEALKIAAEFQPRITLLDTGLPDIDGFEVARRLRAAAKFKTMTRLHSLPLHLIGPDRARMRVISITSSLNLSRWPTCSRCWST
jgi:CheY-like chemotaxis protein